MRIYKETLFHNTKIYMETCIFYISSDNLRTLISDSKKHFLDV